MEGKGYKYRHIVLSFRRMAVEVSLLVIGHNPLKSIAHICLNIIVPVLV